MAVPAAWATMVHQVRNLGRPGVCSMAIAAVDNALWDLKARLLDLVLVPQAHLCCGRPLYDLGMLDTAAAWLRQILDTLRPQIQAAVPVVGMEPSCLAVFRDELTNLFPEDEDARRLASQSFVLSEFLNKKAKDFRWPRLHRRALVHTHCHHKSVMGTDDEVAVLKQLGLDFYFPWARCCGLAGSFGFEAEHYDISMKVGEQALLPAVRQADADTLVIANGFRCQEQIDQGRNRHALHLAQVIQMALRQERGTEATAPTQRSGAAGRPSLARTAAFFGAGLLLGGLAAWALTRRTST